MKQITAIAIVALLASCSQQAGQKKTCITPEDSLTLVQMVGIREQAMKNKDLPAVTGQFYSNANFINGGGFWYEGLDEIKLFHKSMFENDSLDYSYKAGKVMISPVQNDIAIVYYPWEQLWTMKKILSDTLHETGLMTIIAMKENGSWKWRSITNQRTKEFFNDLKEHKSK